MKKCLLYAVMLMSVVCACQKEHNVFILVAGDYVTQSKVHIDEAHYSVWDDGDSVSINGVDYVVSVDPVTHTAYINDVAEADYYHAWYPARCADLIEPYYSAHAQIVQHYRENAFGEQVVDGLMAASMFQGSTLKFHNHNALLAVVINNTTDNDMHIQRIMLQDMNGMELTYGDGVHPQLLCDGELVEANSRRLFYIVIPYCVDARMNIQVYDDSYCYSMTQQNHTITILPNEIHQVTFPVEDAERVQYAPLSKEIWYTTSDGSTIMPNYEQGFGTSLLNNTYRDGHGVLTFSGPVGAIGEHAFERITNLTGITFPAGMDSVSEFAFRSCTSLDSVRFAKGLVSIGQHAFEGCTKLTSVKFPSTLMTIGNYSFKGCSRLASITFPKNLSIMGEYAFWGCATLVTVNCYALVAPVLGYAAFGSIADGASLHVKKGSDYSSWNNEFDGRVYYDLR